MPVTPPEQRENAVVICPEHDRLDGTSGREIVQLLRPHVERGAHVVLNLTNVTYLNSEALGYITMTCRRIRHRRGSLRVCCLNPGPRDVLRMTKLDRALDGIHESEQEALASLR